ncbi:MAG TPA: SemiSWEET transporter [Gammaproteobacteria bacterium]
MDIPTLLGLGAGTLTTLAFVPQVLKTWRSKSGNDISLGMFLLFSTGVLLWLIYGILIDALPVILANAVTLLLSLTVVALKLRYQRREHRI